MNKKELEQEVVRLKQTTLYLTIAVGTLLSILLFLVGVF